MASGGECGCSVNHRTEPGRASFCQAVVGRGERGPGLCFSLSGHLGRYHSGHRHHSSLDTVAQGPGEAFASPVASDRPPLSWLNFQSSKHKLSSTALSPQPTYLLWALIPPLGIRAFLLGHKPLPLLPAPLPRGLWGMQKQKGVCQRTVGPEIWVGGCKWTQGTRDEIKSVLEASVQWANLIPSQGSSLLGPFRVLCSLPRCHPGIS